MTEEWMNSSCSAKQDVLVDGVELFLQNSLGFLSNEGVLQTEVAYFAGTKFSQYSSCSAKQDVLVDRVELFLQSGFFTWGKSSKRVFVGIVGANIGR